MIYANDQWLLLPVKDLYDSLIMLASILQAREMYKEQKEELDAFKKEYGDFISPIQNDMDWYNENVTGKVRKAIADLYAHGIDPLRSAEGRSYISRIINSIDYGGISMLRQSAENANEFKKQRSRLEAAGLYNPLYAKYDAPDLNTYSTLGKNGSGVWGKMSPTPIQDTATFGNPYFEGMKPNIKHVSKNGVDYTIESITEDDLRRIADSKFNELVNTPQGLLMYKYYRDLTGDDTKAREMFNSAIAAAQDRRTYIKDDYDDNYYKRQTLIHQQNQDNLARQRLAWDMKKEAEELRISRIKAGMDSGDEGTKLEGFSLAKTWYEKFAANAWGANGVRRSRADMPDSYQSFSRDADKVFYDFGLKFATKFNKDDFKKWYIANSSGIRKSNDLKNWDNLDYYNRYIKPRENEYRALLQQANYNNTLNAYKSQFSDKMDPVSVAGIIGKIVAGTDRVAQATDENINNLYGVDDVITNTAGYTKKYKNNDTKEIRAAIKQYGVENTTITALGDGYGALRKDMRRFDIKPRVLVKIKDKDGNIVFLKEAYYDINLHSNRLSGDLSVGGYKERGGTVLYGKPKLGLNVSGGLYLPDGYYQQNTPTFGVYPSQGVRNLDLSPSFEDWGGYGPWDIRATSNLKATSSVKSSAYPD